MEILNQIADILEELGFDFDYIQNTGDLVVVVKVDEPYHHVLFEAKDAFSLLSFLERKRE